MSIYEIINPSDHYTFEAPDDTLARLVGLVLGEGRYGIEGPDGETVLAIYIFGVDESTLDHLFQPEHKSLAAALEARRAELPAALRSVMIASRAERADILAALDAMESDAARDAFREHYHDTKRSSLNDIGAYAWALADHMEVST